MSFSDYVAARGVGLHFFEKVTSGKTGCLVHLTFASRAMFAGPVLTPTPPAVHPSRERGR